MDCNKLVWDLNRNRKSTLNVWHQVCQSTFTEKVFCRILLDVFFFLLFFYYYYFHFETHLISEPFFFFLLSKSSSPIKMQGTPW